MKKVTFSVPFDPALLTKAKKLAKRYGVTLDELVEALLVREMAARKGAKGGAQ